MISVSTTSWAAFTCIIITITYVNLPICMSEPVNTQSKLTCTLGKKTLHVNVGSITSVIFDVYGTNTTGKAETRVLTANLNNGTCHWEPNRERPESELQPFCEIDGDRLTFDLSKEKVFPTYFVDKLNGSPQPRERCIRTDDPPSKEQKGIPSPTDSDSMSVWVIAALGIIVGIAVVIVPGLSVYVYRLKRAPSKREDQGTTLPEMSLLIDGEEKIKELQEELKEEKNKVCETKKDKDKLLKELEETKDEKDKALKELEETKDEKDKALKELKETKTSRLKIQAQLKSQDLKFKATENDLRKDLELEKNNTRRLGDVITGMKQTETVLKQSISRLDKQWETLEHTVKKKDEKIKELEERLCEREIKIKELSTAFNNRRNSNADLQKQLADLQKQLDAYQEKEKTQVTGAVLSSATLHNRSQMDAPEQCSDDVEHQKMDQQLEPLRQRKGNQQSPNAQDPAQSPADKKHP